MQDLFPPHCITIYSHRKIDPVHDDRKKKSPPICPLLNSTLIDFLWLKQTTVLFLVSFLAVLLLVAHNSPGGMFSSCTRAGGEQSNLSTLSSAPLCSTSSDQWNNGNACECINEWMYAVRVFLCLSLVCVCTCAKTHFMDVMHIQCIQYNCVGIILCSRMLKAIRGTRELMKSL